MASEISESARKAREELAKKPNRPKSLTGADFLSTGITPLNLACTGRAYGGLIKGKIYRIIGQSGTAKTMLALQILCEAAVNPGFKKYDLTYNDIEGGLEAEIKKFWPPLVGRLQPPYVRDGQPLHDTQLDEFYARLRTKMAKGKPFVEVVDSLDGLVDASGETKMGDNKAKRHAQEMRKLISPLRETGSILILIQHAKANVGNSWGGLVTSGGSSPEFYSTLDVWLGRRETLRRSYKTKVSKPEDEYEEMAEAESPGEDKAKPHELEVGVMYLASVKKNRTQGTPRKVRFPFYYEYGIDDTAACVKYLVEFGHWPKANGRITASDFGYEPMFELDLVKRIETDDKLQELRVLCRNVWTQIEQALSMQRRPKYG